MKTPHSLVCIGHRGAMGYAPENTLKSIETALMMGARWIEIDVYWVDQQLVVFHDEKLDRTTNGTGLLVEQSFDYLRSLDAGEGQKIPTLAEVCQLIKGKASLNIELKGLDTAGPVVRFLEERLKQGWSRESFLISSFDYPQLAVIQKRAPNIAIALLITEAVDYVVKALKLNAVAVNPSLEITNQALVDSIHQHGMKVYVYTVNTDADIAHMHQLQVDGIFTNYPDRVVKIHPQDNL